MSTHKIARNVAFRVWTESRQAQIKTGSFESTFGEARSLLKGMKSAPDILEVLKQLRKIKMTLIRENRDRYEEEVELYLKSEFVRNLSEKNLLDLMNSDKLKNRIKSYISQPELEMEIESKLDMNISATLDSMGIKIYEQEFEGGEMFPLVDGMGMYGSALEALVDTKIKDKVYKRMKDNLVDSPIAPIVQDAIQEGLYSLGSNPGRRTMINLLIKLPSFQRWARETTPEIV